MLLVSCILSLQKCKLYLFILNKLRHYGKWNKSSFYTSFLFFLNSKQFGFDRLIIAKYYVLESAYFLKTN